MISLMPFEPKVKLGKVGNSFRVTIPMEMIQDLGWKEGDTLRVGLEVERLTIRKAEKAKKEAV